MKRYSLLLIMSVLSLAVFAIFAQQGDGFSGPVTVFTNARIIDGTGKAATDGMTLVVRGKKIESIGAAASVKVPEGAKVFDLAGKTVMPALISSHAHLGFVKGTKTSADHVTEENVRRQLERYGDYGVATVVSLGADRDFIFDLRKERRERPEEGPAVLTAGKGFGAKGGVPPLGSGFTEIYRPENAEEAAGMVAEAAAKKPDFIKIWIDDAGGTLPVKMTREVRRTILNEARKHGVKVAAHVYYLADAKELVNEGVDVIAHSIRDQEVDDELIAAMKERGTRYIPTLFLDEAFFVYADQPEWMKGDFFLKALEPGVEELVKPQNFKERPGSRDVLARAMRNVKKLHDAGIPVGLGTDSGATPLRVQGFAEHRELQLLVTAGLTPLEAIRCATKGNAELIGEGDRTGSLEAGKQADFLVLGADPSEDIRNTEKIEEVWITGKKR